MWGYSAVLFGLPRAQPSAYVVTSAPRPCPQKDMTVASERYASYDMTLYPLTTQKFHNPKSWREDIHKNTVTFPRVILPAQAPSEVPAALRHPELVILFESEFVGKLPHSDTPNCQLVWATMVFNLVHMPVITNILPLQKGDKLTLDHTATFDACNCGCPLSKCKKCGCVGALAECMKCKRVGYCSPACQQSDVQAHKQQCTLFRAKQS